MPECDPFNESISSKIACNLDQFGILQDAQLMHNSMKNLELSPPAEFFEEAPLVPVAGSMTYGSAMTLTVPTGYLIG